MKTGPERPDRKRVPAAVVRSSRAVAWIVAAAFFVGLGLRVAALGVSRESPAGSASSRADALRPRQGDAFNDRLAGATRWRPAQCRPYLENDEKLYVALVEQLAAGRGYTLRGHSILREPWIVREQYDRALFFHPPGGIAFFRLLHALFGDAGLPLAQVLSWILFFWSVLLLGSLTIEPLTRSAAAALAAAAAISPIAAHAAARYWLDAPLLAFTTAAAAVFLLGLRRRRAWLAGVAGLLLGYASLIKLTAFLVVPGLAALAWAVTPPDERRGLLRPGLLLILIAALVQRPWEVWQWRASGSPFPSWAGKPAAELVRSNRYVYFLTVFRSPWIYLEMLPQVLWTLAPSLAVLAARWNDRPRRSRALALLLWIAAVLGAHVVLGAIGYSKVLRYVILVTPPAVALFALAVDGLVRSWRERTRRTGGRALALGLAIFLAAGAGLELARSLKTTFDDNRRLDLIRPLTGLRGMDFGRPKTTR